jgi:Rrf2 family cysteine metabolism transcriptional repressor
MEDMVHISKRSEYGIQFLTLLAKRNSDLPVSIATASEELQLPYRFLSQIASDLKKSGVLKSKEGIKGGYTLVAEPDQLTVKQIVELLDGPIGVVDCCQGKPCERFAQCDFKDQFKQISCEVTEVLEKYTIENFYK